MAPTLADVRAAPDDRELLLVYADWLQSRGHPRGELIAVFDAADRARDPATYADARARARALVEDHAILRPPVPGDRGATPRGIWASWERGFVRRLELRVDQTSPGGWAELLAAIMEHPSLALVEHLLLRFDLRGEPVDETEVALDVAIRGLQPWLEADGQKPALQLDLWTQRVPSFHARERLVASLPGLRPFWFGLDITVIPPPRRSPILNLERELARAGSLPTRFDLLWFDAQGQFFARLDAYSLGYQTALDVYDSTWQVHVRRLAEGYGPPLLGAEDPLAERRLARFLDGLAPRLDPRGESVAPRRAWTARPQLMDLDAGLRRISMLWGPQASAQIEGALLDFDAAVSWYWMTEARGEGRWTGLVGLGDEQLLALALISEEAVDGGWSSSMMAGGRQIAGGR